MKKKKNVLPENSVMHKIRLGAVRQEQVRQGIFDGRFRTKTEQSKKIFNRNRIKYEKL
jgi:hypothetical protein